MAKSQNASEEPGRGNFLSDIKIHKPVAVKILQYWYRNIWLNGIKSRIQKQIRACMKN